MSRSWSVRRLRVSVLGLSAALALGTNQVYPADNIRLASGTAWLASGKVGQLPLLDGSSAEVAAAGNQLDVVQRGTAGGGV